MLAQKDIASTGAESVNIDVLVPSSDVLQFELSYRLAVIQIPDLILQNLVSSFLICYQMLRQRFIEILPFENQDLYMY